MADEEKLIEYDKKVIAIMIKLYCDNHHNNKGLCKECKALVDYCNSRIDKCPFGRDKRTCRVCKIHCYDPEHREMIRKIMKYSGPRLILYHPVMLIKHLIKEI